MCNNLNYSIWKEKLSYITYAFIIVTIILHCLHVHDIILILCNTTLTHSAYITLQFCETDGTLTRDHDEPTRTQSYGILAGSYQVCSRMS